MTQTHISPAHWSAPPPLPDRPAGRSIWRGLAQRCPCCGIGHLFRRYLKTADACSSCGEEMHHQRADDAPPYFTMLIVGHLIIPMLLSVEMAYAPPIWLHMTIWPTAAVVLSLLLLQPVKGALVGLQWALRMHGFGEDTAEHEDHGAAGQAVLKTSRPDPGPTHR